MPAKPPSEFKIISLRECPCPPDILNCDQPRSAVDYWRLHVPAHPCFNPDVECLVALLLNTRMRVMGHHLVSTGLLDQILCHPREVFRAAITAAAHSIVVMHNHPSGDPSPSDADIRATRELVRAGKVVKIELLDHIIIGSLHHPPGHISLRSLGHVRD